MAFINTSFFIPREKVLSHVQQQLDKVSGGVQEEALEAFQTRLLETPGANLAEMLKAAHDETQAQKKAFTGGLLKGCLLGAAGAAVGFCPFPGAQVAGIVILTASGCIIADARDGLGQRDEAISFEKKLADQANEMGKNLFQPIPANSMGTDSGLAGSLLGGGLRTPLAGGNPEGKFIGGNPSGRIGYQDLGDWKIR